MDWPRLRYVFSVCLNTAADPFGCLFVLRHILITHRELQAEGEVDGVYQCGILMFIYTMANKMCAPQQGAAE